MSGTLLESPSTTRTSEQRHDPLLLELTVTTHMRPNVTYDELLELCELNRDVHFEWDPSGTLYIMSPAAGGSSHKNVELSFQLQGWARSNKLGIAFDSSGGFILPNGMMRNPDGAWIRRERWDSLTKDQQERGFPPLAPDFVLELRSPSDKRQDIQAKMNTYIANGVRLAWLIDPIDGEVEVHRAGQPAELLKQPKTLSGEDVLPGFILDLTEILAK
jgi:Uma2 family endonuclease